jgi:DNA-binding GntR family transcriptional regulator
LLEQGASTVEQVISALKEGVKTARYAPGQRIIEPQLMSELNVSRGSVREALRRLAAEGLVEWERYKGASIIRMSRQQVVDFMDLRELLEGHAARLAANRIDDQGRKAFAALERSRGAGSTIPSYYDDYNNNFHDLILRVSGNLALPDALNQIRLPIMRLQFNRILLLPNQIKLSRRDHNKIVRAIAKGDGDGAETAMRNHIRHSAECILLSPETSFA